MKTKASARSFTEALIHLILWAVIIASFLNISF